MGLLTFHHLWPEACVPSPLETATHAGGPGDLHGSGRCNTCGAALVPTRSTRGLHGSVPTVRPTPAPWVTKDDSLPYIVVILMTRSTPSRPDLFRTPIPPRALHAYQPDDSVTFGHTPRSLPSRPVYALPHRSSLSCALLHRLWRALPV